MTARKDYGCPLRIWDNGGKTADRYTILPPRSQRAMRRFRNAAGAWEGIRAATWAAHPATRRECCVIPGPHLGRRITWQELPEQVQQFARQVFPEYCPVSGD